MLQDEMTFQRIEVLLDIQAKKLLAEIHKLHEELSQVKEDLRKEIHSVRQDNFTPGPVRTQMWADAPQHVEQQPVPRYAQEHYAQQEHHPVYADAMPAGRMPQERQPESRPIDRNGVAPADVSVEKFFYTGSKKK